MRSIDRALVGRLVRFALTGGVSTLLYGVATWWFVGRMHMAPALASLLGYLLAVPVNFLLQRSFAFRSSNAVHGDAARYLLAHGANMAASTLFMQVLVAWLHMDYRIGIVVTMIAVPVLMFLLLDRWVFAKRA